MIGIFLIEAADHAEAKTIAKDCPILLSGGSVEIRETEQLETPKPALPTFMLVRINQDN